MNSANERQVGGGHYQKDGLQHWDVMGHVLGFQYHFMQASKYLARWRDKNGSEDLKKADHYLQKAQEIATRNEDYLQMVFPPGSKELEIVSGMWGADMAENIEGMRDMIMSVPEQYNVKTQTIPVQRQSDGCMCAYMHAQTDAKTWSCPPHGNVSRQPMPGYVTVTELLESAE